MWDVRAKFAIAKAQLAQSKLNDARSSFRRAKSAADSVIAQSTTPNALATSMMAASVVGEGETLVAEKKYSDALRYFERFQRDKNPAVAAASLAGKGEALYLQSIESGNQDQLRAAQIALAQANLDDTLGGATSAKAMYYSGMVLLALGKEREAPDYAQRAQSYFQSVVATYGDTSWAALAKAQVK